MVVPGEYANWRTGEPNNALGGEDATMITADGTWLDFGEFNTRKYLLEVSSSDVIIDANVTATGGDGDITLTAANDIEQNSGDITAAGAGAIDYNAGTDADDGVVTMAAGTDATSGTGLITIDADGDITLGGIATGGEAQIETTSGAIVDGSDTATDLAASTAELISVTGIGSANALETAIGTLAFENSTSGNVNISNTGGLTIGNVNTLTSSSNGGTGTTTLSATSPVTYAHNMTSGGTLTADAIETAPSTNLIHEYYLDGDGTDSAGSADGTVGGNVTFSSMGVPANLLEAAVIGTVGGAAEAITSATITDFGTGDFSISMWINRANADTGDVDGVLDARNSAAGFDVSFDAADNFELTIDDGTTSLTEDLFIQAGTGWKHYVISVDRDSTTGLVAYLDGALQGSFDPTSVNLAINPDQDLVIGDSNGAAGLDGQIGMLQFYDKALTPAEVTDLFGAGQGFDNVTVNAGVTVKSTAGDVIFNAGDNIYVSNTATVQSDTGNVTLNSGVSDSDDIGRQQLDGNIQVASGTATINLNTEAGPAAQASGGTIMAANLRLLSGAGTAGGGSFDLDQSTTNDVATIAAATDGAIAYRDANALAVGTATTVGITTSNDNVTLCATSISVDQNIAAGSGTVRLHASGGDVAETGTAQIVAGSLGVVASGAINLSTSTNNVSTFAASAGTTLFFHEADGYMVGTVTADDTCFPGVTGVNGTDVELKLDVGGFHITLPMTISGTLRMQTGAGGAVTQTSAGVIHAANLGVRAAGNIDLNTAVNNVTGTFAARSTGTGVIEFADQGGFTVGTVTAGDCFLETVGVTTMSGAIELTNAAGTLTVNDVVTAGGGGNVTVASQAGPATSGGYFAWPTFNDTSTGSQMATTLNGIDATLNYTPSGGSAKDFSTTADDATFLTSFPSPMIGYELLPDVNSSVTFTQALPLGSRLLVLDVDMSPQTVTLTVDGAALTAFLSQLDTQDPPATTTNLPAYDNVTGVLSASDPAGNDFEATVFDLTGATSLSANLVGGDGASILIYVPDPGPAATDDLDVNANISAIGGTGNVNLYAADTIDIDAAVTVSAASTGAVSASAGTDFNSGNGLRNGTDAGNVAMANGSTIQSQDGNITLRAPNNVSLSTVDADSDNTGTVGNVVVTADYDGPDMGLSDGTGGISDNLTGEAANITSNSVALRAGSGIGDGLAGAAGDIDTEITTLATHTHSGDTNIDETDDLTVGTHDTLSGVSIDNADATASGDDDITLVAAGSLTVSQDVSNADEGDITLTVGDDILQDTAAAVSAAGAGNVDYNAATTTTDGVITMADGTSVASESGIVTMDADGDITISGVSTSAATPATTAGVRIETTAGAIKDAGESNNPDIKAASVALRALTGIGDADDTSGRLETATAGAPVTTLTLAAVTESGDIGLRNTGSLTIATVDSLVGVVITDTVDNNQGDDIIITAASPITVNDVVTNNDGGDITMAAEGGAFDLVKVDLFNIGTDPLQAGFTAMQGASSSAVVNAVTVTVQTGNAFNSGPVDTGDGLENLGIDGSLGAATIDFILADLPAGDYTFAGYHHGHAFASATNEVYFSVDGTAPTGLGYSVTSSQGTVAALASGTFSFTADGVNPLQLDVQPDTGNSLINGFIVTQLSRPAATDDLTINANITAAGGNGNINLYAADSISLDDTIDPTVSAAGSGNVLVSASTNYRDGVPENGFQSTDNTTEGLVDMGDGSTITSESGNIKIQGEGDVKLSEVTTTGSVLVTADFAGVEGGSPGRSDEAGAIIDNLDVANASTTDINITALNVALRAGGGIGDDGDDNDDTNDTADIDTASLTGQTLTLAAETEAGDIIITNQRSTTIGTVSDPFTAALIPALADLSGAKIVDATVTVANQDTTNDNIKVIAQSPMTVSQPVVNNDGGDIKLAAEGRSDIVWVSPVNVTIDGNKLTKVGGVANNWDAGAIGNQTIPAGRDAYVETTALEDNTGRMFGFSDVNTDAGFATLDYAVWLRNNGFVGVYESGANRGTFGSYSVNDVFRVQRVGTTMTYLRNGSVFYTSLVASNTMLTPDVSIHTSNGTIGNAVLATGDLAVNANISATGGAGAVNLYGWNHVELDPVAEISAAGSGAVLVQAGTDFNAGVPQNGTATGNIAMGDGSTIESQDGDITLEAPGDVSLSTVDADSDDTGGAGTVIVTADFAGVDAPGTSLSDNVGKIIDNLTGEGSGSINVAGGAAVLRAPQGIGSGVDPADIDTDLGDNNHQSRANLAALNTISGDIQIDDVGSNSYNLTIGTVDSLIGITNLSPGGKIVVSNASPITKADDVIADSDITITAGDDAADDAGATADLVDGGGGTTYTGTTGDSTLR